MKAMHRRLEKLETHSVEVRESPSSRALAQLLERRKRRGLSVETVRRSYPPGTKIGTVIIARRRELRATLPHA